MRVKKAPIFGGASPYSPLYMGYLHLGGRSLKGKVTSIHHLADSVLNYYEKCLVCLVFFSSSSIFFLSNCFLFSILLDFARIHWICPRSFSVLSSTRSTSASLILDCELKILFGAEMLIRRKRLRDWVLRSRWPFSCCSTAETLKKRLSEIH